MGGGNNVLKRSLGDGLYHSTPSSAGRGLGETTHGLGQQHDSSRLGQTIEDSWATSLAILRPLSCVVRTHASISEYCIVDIRAGKWAMRNSIVFEDSSQLLYLTPPVPTQLG